MTESNKRFYPLVLLGDGLLLLCAVVGLTASFLTLYGGSPEAAQPFLLGTYLVERGIRPLCGWAALFALISLCVWSLPRFRLAAAGALTAAWAGAVWWNWDTAWEGGGLTVRAVTQQFAQWVSWGGELEFQSNLPTVSQRLEAMELFLILAIALVALLMGLAVVEGKCWWLAVLLGLPPLLPGLLADFYPAWVPFMALCASWCTMLITRLCHGAAPSSRGRLTLAVLPAVGLVLAGLSVALPREGYTRPAWAYAAEEELTNLASRMSRFFDGLDGPFRTTVTYVGAAEAVDLSGAGPLNYTGRTVLRVASDYTGHLYLRGTSLAVYNGGSWTALPDGTYQEYLDEAGRYSSLNPTPLIFPALIKGDGAETYTATVDNVGASGSCVYTPYQLAGQDWAENGMLPVEDTYFARRRGEWSNTMTFMTMGLGENTPVQGESGVTQVRVESGQSYTSPSVYNQEQLYRNYVWRHYLDVPEELRALLNQIAAEGELYAETDQLMLALAGSSLCSPGSSSGISENREVMYARLVSALLNDRCEYDPNTPLTPTGEDFVEYFLTTSRRGYCMHFASAAVLLLRNAGIPARYVSGFTVDTVAGKRVDVPDRAAHAWVEIYIDGYGWYPVEVTPNYTWETEEPGTEPGEPSQQPSEPPEESDEPAQPSDLPETSQPPQGGGDGPEKGGGSGWIRFLLWGAGLAGMAALVWLVQYLIKKYRGKQMAGPNANRAALDGYRCLTRMERWGGTVDEQAVELAQKAKFSQHTLTEEERQAMADWVDHERLRLSRELPVLKRVMFRYWWGKPKRDGRRIGTDGLE